VDRLKKVVAAGIGGAFLFLWLSAVGSPSYAQPGIKSIVFHATDCTGVTAAKGTFCFEQDAGTLYMCNPAAAPCDEAGDWDGPLGFDGTGGTMPDKDFFWQASSLLPAQPADLIPPLSLAAGTNFDLMYRAFDDATDEWRVHRCAVGSGRAGL
jgi:hypothetical protein